MALVWWQNHCIAPSISTACYHRKVWNDSWNFCHSRQLLSVLVVSCNFSLLSQFGPKAWLGWQYMKSCS